MQYSKLTPHFVLLMSKRFPEHYIFKHCTDKILYVTTVSEKYRGDE
jgi:hypothetical protein